MLSVINTRGVMSVVPNTAAAPWFPCRLQPLLAMMFSQSGAAAVPIFTNNCFLELSYTINPAAGLTMAFTALLSIRGINNPLDELLISSWAEALGEEVPTPTLWASQMRAKTTMTKKIVRIFFTAVVLVIVGFQRPAFKTCPDVLSYPSRRPGAGPRIGDEIVICWAGGSSHK